MKQQLPQIHDLIKMKGKKMNKGLYYTLDMLGNVNIHTKRPDENSSEIFTSERALSDYYNEKSAKAGLVRIWFNHYGYFATKEITKEEYNKMLGARPDAFFMDFTALRIANENYDKKQKEYYRNKMSTYRGLLEVAREKAYCEEYTDLNYVAVLDEILEGGNHAK